MIATMAKIVDTAGIMHTEIQLVNVMVQDMKQSLPPP
jgi:hypothetical protein